MLSVCAFARAAPRSIFRLTVQSSRPSISAFRNTARLQATWTPITRAAVAPFSTSMRRHEAIEELAAKLESEIQVEEDLKESSETSSNAEEFQEYFKGVWDLHDEAGSQEVRLTRKFNDENIEISFSVADANMEQSGMEGSEDGAYEDEEFDEPEVTPQSGGANTKGSVNAGKTQGGNIRVATEDKVAPADRPELNDEEGGFGEEEERQGTPFPVRLSVKVTRDGKPGALEIDSVASNGYIEVQNASYWPSAEMAGRTAEAEAMRSVLYGGPSYHTLDADLQDLMDQFLEERGINTEMSLRLPDIVDWKEQKEYMKWLHDVKGFLS